MKFSRTAMTAVLCATLLVPAAAGGEGKKSLTTAELLGIRFASTPAISPDGAFVAFVVQEPADTLAGESRRQADIWLASAEDGGAGPFAFGPARESAPAWSPDGRWIYFLSDRGETGAAQVWRIGARGGEAEPVTRVKDGVTSFALSPDGGGIALTAPDPEDETVVKAREAGRDWKVAGEPRRCDRLRLASLDEVPVRETEAVTPADLHVTSFAWSPDGSRIAMICADDPGNDEVYWHSRLEALEVSSRTRAVLCEDAEGRPAWSADGRSIAFTYRLGHPEIPLTAPVVGVVGSDGSGLRLVGEQLTGTLVQPAWLPGSDRLLALHLDGVHARLAAVPTDGGELETIETLDIPYYLGGNAFDVSIDGSKIAFLRGGPDSPPDVWLWSRGLLRGSRRLSTLNRWLEDRELPGSRVVRWKSRDGSEIEGVVWLPAGFRNDGSFPAIVCVHGGPMWAWWFGWHGTWHDWAIPLAGRGYVVLLPNPRGSLGYGPGFARANFDDWGGGDYEDVIAGADFLVSEKYADPKRLGIAGWSYGGFMTAWTVTRTNRFAAAVAGAGVTNLFSFHGTTDITPTFLARYFREIAFLRAEAYRAHSPVEFVQRASTPTLVVHGEEDARVPVGQAYEFYQGLKQTGVPCELVVYPREGHSFAEIRHQADLVERIAAWFDERLGR